MNLFSKNNAHALTIVHVLIYNKLTTIETDTKSVKATSSPTTVSVNTTITTSTSATNFSTIPTTVPIRTKLLYCFLHNWNETLTITLILNSFQLPIRRSNSMFLVSNILFYFNFLPIPLTQWNIHVIEVRVSSLWYTKTEGHYAAAYWVWLA